jgi:asparagine synthetase B (glutamine-hydrolysing)
MSKFFLVKGEIKNRYRDKVHDSSLLLTSTDWDKLYSFERNGFYLNWTNSGKSSEFYKEGDDIILLTGNLFKAGDIRKKLKETLANINNNNYLDYLNGLDGAYCLVIKKGDTLIVTNDILGASPLVYYLEQGQDNVIFSTDLKIFRNILDMPINIYGIVEKMMCSCALEDTFLEKVKVLESNIAFKYTGKSSIKNTLSRTEGTNVYRDYSDEKLLAKIDELLIASMKGYGICNGRSALSLSGGIDSRFLLGGMRKNLRNSDILALTFSTKRNTEHIIATKLCKKLGISHETLYFREFSLKNIEHFLWQTEEITVVDSLYYSEYIDFMHKWGLPVSNGFMLDALTGHSGRFWYDERKDYPKPHLTFLEKSKENIFKINYIKEDLRRPLEKRISEGAKKIFDKIDNNYPSVNRKLALFNLFTLQKTWNNNIALSINLSGNGIIPAYNKDFINFWLNIPVKHLVNQNLYRKYISVYLKELAEIESTYDLQKIEAIDSGFKKIKFFIKKQLYRATRTYHTPEVIVKNKKMLHQYLMDNKATLLNYFTDRYIKMIGKELKHRSRFSKVMNKMSGRYLPDQALIIPINIIFFEKMLRTPISPLYKAQERVEL